MNSLPSNMDLNYEQTDDYSVNSGDYNDGNLTEEYNYDDVENEIDQSSRKWRRGYCSYQKCCPYKPGKYTKCIQKVSGRGCDGMRPNVNGGPFPSTHPMCRPDRKSGCKCVCTTRWPKWGQCYCSKPNPECEKIPCRLC